MSILPIWGNDVGPYSNLGLLTLSFEDPFEKPLRNTGPFKSDIRRDLSGNSSEGIFFCVITRSIVGSLSPKKAPCSCIV